MGFEPVAQPTIPQLFPFYLLGQGKAKEAHHAITRLFGPDYNVEVEIEIILQNLEQQRKAIAQNGSNAGEDLTNDLDAKGGWLASV